MKFLSKIVSAAERVRELEARKKERRKIIAAEVSRTTRESLLAHHID